MLSVAFRESGYYISFRLRINDLSRGIGKNIIDRKFDEYRIHVAIESFELKDKMKLHEYC